MKEQNASQANATIYPAGICIEELIRRLKGMRWSTEFVDQVDGRLVVISIQSIASVFEVSPSLFVKGRRQPREVRLG